jgi:hypothetical protein
VIKNGLSSFFITFSANRACLLKLEANFIQKDTIHRNLLNIFLHVKYIVPKLNVIDLL